MKKNSGGTDGKTLRHLAIECLVKWEKEKSALQPYVSAVIYDSELSANDIQLAVMLVQGVLRQMQHLDAIIARFAKHPLEKMKPLTRMALRVGVYQLLFLDRVPVSAAVNETVKVLKEQRQPRWIINFVNGVLRSISRAKDELPGAEYAGKEGSAVFNHPQWLVRRWQKRFGLKKAEEICRLNNREPPLTLRVNTLKTDRTELAELLSGAGLSVREGKYAPDSLILDSPAGPLTAMPGYGEGLFHVQDEAAQLVTFMLGPFDGQRNYLDACAGLGGKTCQLAQLVTEGSRLVAVEPAARRFQLLRVNLHRLGLDNRVECVPGTIDDEAGKAAQLFHAILVDAPCSGTGVIRRHPDIRWNREIEDLRAYRQQQQQILHHAAHLLRPGGTMVYATCSMEPEENGEVVEAFLAGNRNFSLSSAAECLPAAAHGLISPEGYFSTTPADGLDGFFGARIVKAVT